MFASGCSTTVHVQSVGMEATIISSVCARSDLTLLCYVHLHCECFLHGLVWSIPRHGSANVYIASHAGTDPFRYCASAPRCTSAVLEEKSLDTQDYCVASLDGVPVFSCWALYIYQIGIIL